jgi:PPM family protein phosphatase
MMPVEKQAAPSIEISASSDTGLWRERNEDAFLFSRAANIAVVADGIGGQPAGEIASKIAVDVAMRELVAAREELIHLSSHQHAIRRITACFAVANSHIVSRATEEPDKAGMGTTLDAVMLIGWNAYLAHVGDGRIYRVRNRQAEQFTADHTLARAFARAGKGYKNPSLPLDEVLTRVLGTPADIIVDLLRVELQLGDTLLLCTDGLWRHFPETEELARVIHLAGPRAADTLVRLATERGGEDNATAVLIHVSPPHYTRHREIA